MHYVDKVHQSSSTGLILESESDLWAYVGAHASAPGPGLPSAERRICLR